MIFHDFQVSHTSWGESENRRKQQNFRGKSDSNFFVTASPLKKIKTKPGYHQALLPAQFSCT